jgi:hypothetical protein
MLMDVGSEEIDADNVDGAMRHSLSRGTMEREILGGGPPSRNFDCSLDTSALPQ